MEANIGQFERIGLEGKISHLNGLIIFKDKKIEALKSRIEEMERMVLPNIALLTMSAVTGDSKMGADAMDTLIKNTMTYVDKYH